MPKIWIEVILASEKEQKLLRLEVETGTKVKEVLSHLDLSNEFDLRSVGIFGMKVSEDYVLKGGDRIELYRDLKVDPKQNRRIRSEKT